MPRRCIPVVLLVLLAVITTLFRGGALAQPREVVAVRGETVELITDPAALDAWLRRLVGSYRLEGAIDDVGIKGKADCVAIGSGPGVHCIFNAIWMEKWDRMGNPILVDPLDPAMFLFGMDPGRSELTMLMVNDKGIASGGQGTVKGTPSGGYGTIIRGLGALPPGTGTLNGITANFRVCTHEGFCQPSVTIEAKADANILYMWVVGAALTMRREDEKGADSPSPPPPG